MPDSFTAAQRQVHDWLILFDCETEHIWRRKWDIGKVLFIVSRYGAFCDIAISLASEFDLIIMVT